MIRVLIVFMIILSFMNESLALYKDRLLGNICAVTTANKAHTALELLRNNRNKFDLVISDLEIDLPVISMTY